MDEKYSKNGVLVKTEELPSFKGECAVVYFCVQRDGEFLY